MKATSWSFIVIAPHSPTLEKFTISYKAALILVVAFVLAFLTTVFLLLMFPTSRVNEPDRVRLAAENQTLRVENKNIAIQLGRLNAQMSRVEQRSQRVVGLMQAD
jgi:hypothetical protein